MPSHGLCDGNWNEYFLLIFAEKKDTKALICTSVFRTFVPLGVDYAGIYDILVASGIAGSTFMYPAIG